MTTGRKYGKPDANHGDIVTTFRACGASVCDLKAVGGGVPDLLIGYHGRNYLVEVKAGEKAPSASKLNALQLVWHNGWTGQVDVVRDVDGAVALMNRWVQYAGSHRQKEATR